RGDPERPGDGRTDPLGGGRPLLRRRRRDETGGWIVSLESRSWPEAPGAGPLGDGRWAAAVHRPSTVAELCEAGQAEARSGGAVYPQGGRTAIDYGRPPGRPGAAVDLTGLCGVVDYPHADMTITVQAGMTISALRAVLA